MLDSKSAYTLGSLGKTLSQFDGDPFLDETLYRSTIGALQHATISRPNISFTVNIVCQFMYKPTTTHWIVINHILHYMMGTLNCSLGLQAADLCFSWFKFGILVF